MKKILCGILLSIALAVILPSFYPNNDWEGKIATLYAVSGIMFSIGMSIIVTSSFTKIKHTRIRKRIKDAFTSVRNSYIVAFLVVSILYMFQNPDVKNITVYKSIMFNYTTLVGVAISFSILFFIINFIDLQKLNDSIDEALDNS